MISLLGEKMQKPNEKKIHRLSPNIFRESIQIYMEKMFDGKKYDKAENCPYCGSTIYICTVIEKKLFVH